MASATRHDFPASGSHVTAAANTRARGGPYCGGVSYSRSTRRGPNGDHPDEFATIAREQQGSMTVRSHNEPVHDAASTRRVARGGVANLIGAAYSGIAAFVITTVVTRIASTEDAGIYFSAISVMLLTLSLAQLGTPVGYVYFLARLRGLGHTDRLRSVLSAGGLPVLAFALILVGIAVIFRAPLGALLFGPRVPDSATIMVILAGVLIIALAAESSLAATRGLGVMRPTVVLDKFVNPTVQTLALLLLAIAGWTGGEELILTRVTGFIVVASLGIPWLFRLLRRYPVPTGQSARQTWLPTSDDLGVFWRFSGPRALGQIAQSAIQRVDIVLVALWLSPTEAAIYAAATRFLVFGQLAGRSISMAVQPRFSTLTARNEMFELQELYRTSTTWIMFATWPFYLTFLVHAPWLMKVFGPEYEPGAIVLQVLAAAMLVATGCGAVDAVLLMAGRSSLTMINAWVALVVNIGFNVLLIPRIGILGAALSWMASILAMNVVPLIQVRVTLRIHPFGRLTMLASVAATVLFGALPWGVSLAGGGFIGAIGCLALAAPTYALLLWHWRERLGMTGLFHWKRAR